MCRRWSAASPCPIRRWPSALCGTASSSLPPPGTAVCAAPPMRCWGGNLPGTCWNWNRQGRAPYRLSGLLTAPRGCRASRSMQFFFINGRFVKNRTMMAALENAYKGTLMQGKFPGCVLNLEMPPPAGGRKRPSRQNRGALCPGRGRVRRGLPGGQNGGHPPGRRGTGVLLCAVRRKTGRGGTGAAKACGRAGTCHGKTGRSRGAACSPPGGSSFGSCAFCPRCRDHAADQRDVCRRKPASQPPGGGGSGNACVYRAFRAGN